MTLFSRNNVAYCCQPLAAVDRPTCRPTLWLTTCQPADRAGRLKVKKEKEEKDKNEKKENEARPIS
jgi:hypothetical protein